MEYYYKVAGLTVAMDSFGRIIDQAKPYLINRPETIDIQIQSEWPKLKQKYPMISDEAGEYLATGKSFYQKLLDFDGMMLHASAVVVDGRAYLFSADCGTGKSTHVGLWLKRFGERAYILNDDKPAMRIVNGTWYAFGTPWSGKYDLSTNTGVPIAGIAMLERSDANEIARFQGKDAIYAIYRQLNRKTETAAFRIKQLELLDKLLTQVPVWKLKCNMDPEAAMVSYEAMSGNAAGDDLRSEEK